MRADLKRTWPFDSATEEKVMFEFRRVSHFGMTIAATIVVVVAFAGAAIYFNSVHYHSLAISAVRVESKLEIGSGVSIGNGYILSANHLIGDKEKVVDIKTSTGEKTKADLLWSNADYDIAAFKLRDDLPMQTAFLDCRTLAVGEHIIAIGNPSKIEFLQTNGQVAGVARAATPWPIVVPVDMVIVQGMSGGPTFDDRGKLVGINIGILPAPYEDSPFGGTDSGIGFIVPSSAICELLAR
jgi:S1-C subfamily serine protease